MTQGLRSITAANDDVLCDLIERASNRLVVLSPVVSRKVASKIIANGGNLGTTEGM